MNERKLSVHLRPDRAGADEVMHRLREGGLVLQQEFLLMVELMERDEVPPRESLEVLAGRYETYALRLGVTHHHLLCDLDTREGRWTLLGINRGPGLRNEAYRAACEVHRLVNPSRERHEERA